LRGYMRSAVDASPDRPVLVDRFLDGAVEVDVDCISDGETTVVGAIMEHIEEAGVHSGDSACVIPSYSLSDAIKEEITRATHDLARELEVRGLMNIQFAVKDEELFVIEVNPRASRTVPFVSKTIGVPLAKHAACVMVGKKLVDLGFTDTIIPPHFAVKEAVFPFARFPGIDIILGPEMKATGEVMGIDSDWQSAYAKSQMAAGNSLPDGGKVFISVRDRDKPGVVKIARKFADLGFEVVSTKGTANFLKSEGVPVTPIFKIAEGRPNILDAIKNGEIAFLVNTPSSQVSREDERKIRAAAIQYHVSHATNLSSAVATVGAIKRLREKPLEVRSIQEYHADMA